MFENEFPDPTELLQLGNENIDGEESDEGRLSNQVMIEMPAPEDWEDYGFLTNGANLDEVLLDFLNQNSKGFTSFQIEEQ